MNIKGYAHGSIYPVAGFTYRYSLFLTFTKAKMDGPEPEIPDPNAPCFRAASFTSLKPGISTLRIGSTITSSSERAIKS